MCSWRCFGWDEHFNWKTEYSRLASPPWWASSNQVKAWIEQKNKTKKQTQRTDPFPNKRESFLTDCLRTGTLTCSNRWTQIETSAVPRSWVCWPSDHTAPLALLSLAFWLTVQNLGLVCLHDHVSQLLIISLCIQMVSDLWWFDLWCFGLYDGVKTICIQ